MYAALINNVVKVSQDLWQIKIPTRIKIFLWYLKRGVVLTKDNLARRNWNGDTRCSFCHSRIYSSPFFECFYAKFLWHAVHLVFGISPPISIDDLFINWSKVVGTIHNSFLLTAASALCWTIWIIRNKVVLDKFRPKFFVQVLFRGTHWLRQWARLQRRDDLWDQLTLAGQHLETSALHFFSSSGWLSTRFFGLS